MELWNFHLLPKECLQSVFWEMASVDPDVDPRFEKEEWFSSTLLEWGRCGKLVMEDGEALAFAEYAPATLFPRLAEFSAGRAGSPHACFLAYCFAEERHRRKGIGSALVREVARDLVDRGFRSVEAVGDRAFDGGWVLPAGFLAANGFVVVAEDPRYPLMRLDLHGSAGAPRRERAVAGAVLSAGD